MGVSIMRDSEFRSHLISTSPKLNKIFILFNCKYWIMFPLQGGKEQNGSFVTTRNRKDRKDILRVYAPTIASTHRQL